MMENENESWLIVSSSDEDYDSDKIDSDIEAELYSVIHHGAETVTSPIDNSISLSPLADKASKTNKIKKTDDTDVHKKIESTETKELDGNSSDEVQIISSSSSCKKRKSDVLNNVLESIQVDSNSGVSSKQSNSTSDTSSHKKQRTNRNGNFKKKSDKSVLNKTVDTSDSDSIIWTEVDECDIKLRTNLENEAVVLSSDSFSSEDTCSPFLGDNSFTSPVNTSQPSTSTFSKNTNDPWYVNSEDIYRSKKRSSRYHERAVLHCSNCNLKGHSFKFCSVPKAVKCYICGGAHLGSRCKHKLCHRCFNPGHGKRFCHQRLVNICIHCNMRGHSTKHCPDLWRRYHLTTNQINIVAGYPLAQNTPIYCFNCGEKGHYGAQCPAPRSDRSSFPTWTSVIEYVHPYDTIQRTADIQRSTRLGGVPVWSPTPAFRPPPQQPMSIYRPYQIQVPVNRQPPPQTQMFINRQTTPQMQMPVNGQAPVQNGLPAKKKKNKKKKKSLANNLLTPPSGMKNKKNKANSVAPTPESSTKKKTQTEVYFPRTPTPIRKEKRLQKKIRKQQNKLRRQGMLSESFTTGLHRRLGLLN